MEKMDISEISADFNREYSKRIADELETAFNCKDPDPDNGVYAIVDYLQYEILDITVRCSMTGEYKSCELIRTLGGPTCIIDTEDKTVKTYYSNDPVGSWGISSEICDEIDYIVSELSDGEEIHP